MSTLARRLRRIPPPLQDVLLAAFVTYVHVQGTHRVADADPDVVARPLTDFGNLGYVLLGVSGMALVVRRRWPTSVFLVTAAASMVYFGASFPDGPGWVGLFVALYTVTAYGDGHRSLQISGLGILVLTVVWLVAAIDIEPRAAIGWVFFRIGASVMAAALGESVRSRRVIAAEAQERADHAERTREEEARRRVDAERLRIAREVHDTVAHAIAIINVQAGVTAHVLDKRPERARETLITIEQTSAQALHEMRAILGVLRDTERDHDSDDADEHGYGRGLNQIDELMTLAREAGLDVNVERGVPPAQLPTAVDRAAYRILQESITNVIRHAGAARVTVSLSYGDADVEIVVVDDGPGGGVLAVAGALQASADLGSGLVGMRERCALLGGDMTAGPRDAGGFEVRARLPLQPAERVAS